MHSGYLDRQAESVISIAELKGKLADLEERRLGAERELEKLTHHEEAHGRTGARRRGADCALPQPGSRGPRPAPTPEDKHETYKMLGIKVIAYPGGSIQLTGRVFVDVHSDKDGMISNGEYHVLAR